MKKILFTLFISASILSFSQSIISTSVGTSLGFNYEKSYLWKYEVESSPSIGGYLSLNYEYRFVKPYFIRFKLGFHQFYAQSIINNNTTKGYNYNFTFPLTVGYCIKEKWDTEIGIGIQDYRDRDEFALIKSYNIRYNLIVGLTYKINDKWSVELLFSRMLSEKIDAFVIKHYTDHFMIGANYQLFSQKK